MAVELHFDHIGYARAYGGYIGKPSHEGGDWSIYFGAHPHDPDHDAIYVGKAVDKECALAVAKNKYREWLTNQLESLDADV